MQTVSWLETVVLLDFSAISLTGKIDTGAKGCVLSGFNIFTGNETLYFDTCIYGKTQRLSSQCFRYQQVRSSNGQIENRPVVALNIAIAGAKLEKVEFTLRDRREMNYPILIGRDVITGRFLIDCSAPHS